MSQPNRFVGNFSLLREDEFPEFNTGSMTSPASKRSFAPKFQRQENIYSLVKQEKKQRWEEIALKLAFRQYLKEKGITKTETDLAMQEIYNRYFFYRKEEVQNTEPRNSASLRFSPPRKTRNGSQVTGLARSLVNFEDLKSRDSLKKLSKESMVSSPLDRHHRSKMGVEE